MVLAVYSKTCSKNVSGNSRIFIAEIANISVITVTAGEITAITASSSFMEIEADVDSIIRTEEPITGKLNRTMDISVDMKLSRPTAAVNTLRNSLADASPCGMAALVRDGNGTWWLVGYNEEDLLTRPLYLSEDGMTSGAELVDLEGNKVSAKLSRSMAEPSLPLSAALGATIDDGSALFCYYAGQTFSSEFQPVYDSWSTKPGVGVAAQMDTMVAALVAAGVWSKLDLFYLFAAHTNGASEALKNWINPGTFDATNVHASAFVALEGFTGDGVNDYLNTNWNPNTDGVKFLQDDACAGAYSRSDVQDSSRVFGCAAGGTAVYLYPYAILDGDFYLTVNQLSTSNDPNTDADSLGMFVINRAAAGSSQGYKNKSLITDDPQASVGVPSADLYILGYNSGGLSEPTTRQISCFLAGGSLTPTEINNATDAIEAYMDSNSKGVIP